MGSLESRQSSGYIQQYLKSLGYDVNYLHFESVIADRKNVGTSRSSRDRIVGSWR